MNPNHNAINQRVQVLVSQSRYPEAIGFLKDHLTQFPSDLQSMMMLANIYILNEDKEEAKQLLFHLNEVVPNEPAILEMMAELDIQNEYFGGAEQKLEMLLQQNPEDAQLYVMMARLKFAQNNYDKALEFAELALEIDPENLNALNLKLITSSLLGQKDLSESAISEAMQRDPNNPGTIANKALHALRQGHVIAALEEARHALSIDPNNEMARYVMAEAMKSKFWPYKMMFIFHQKMARMTSTQSWGIIIGGYILLQLLSRAAENNKALQPFFYPLIFLIISFFLATWILTPLMNAYLLTNKYGKYLLDDDDTKMAKLTIGTIGISLIFVLIIIVTGNPIAGIGAMIFFLFTIPLGSFLNPPKKSLQLKLTYFTIAIITSGILGLLFMQLTGNAILLFASGLGLFAYQWIYNGVMIKAGARIKDK